MPGQGGQLDLRTIIQQVVQANPGVKDPRVIAAAVDKFLPIMNAQSQQQWRQIGLQLRAATVEQGQQRVDQGQQRVDQGEQRVGIAQQNADTSAGRAETAKDQGQQRIDVSKGREERLSGQAKVRQDQGWQRLELQRKGLERQIVEGKQRNYLGQWRQMLDAQHKRAQEIISSQQAGMGGDERTKLIKEEDQFYKGQIEEMRGKLGEGGNSAAPSAPDVPKPGDVRDGYKFKGGDPSKQESWDKVGAGAQ
jgi:hypothetical protein